ncbi:MAG: hypothetical protein NUV51_05015 [Sulfuricaulis sp.]|nr:hypothetical protein [Sulfuricaulis sp.]
MRNASSLDYRHAASNKPAVTVHCSYVPLSCFPDYIAESTGKILAVVGFGGETLDIPPLPYFRVEVTTPPLADTHLTEVWTSTLPVIYREQGGIHYTVSGDVLFGSIRLSGSDEATMDVTTRTAYKRIFDLLQTEAYPHLIRAWNFVPDINKTINGLEQYQLFCMGRHQAFSECNRYFELALPAASAIGVRQGDLHIYFLAARHAGRQIENPRQVSAFHYPRCYGPRSPSFSRAILKEWNDGRHLYISGTASIIGHEICHNGSLDKQLQETLRNIESLLEHAGHVLEIREKIINNLSCMKIYMRHPDHLVQVKNSLERHFGHEMPAIYLQGDLCRSDLLLEIEAICHVRQYIGQHV